MSSSSNTKQGGYWALVLNLMKQGEDPTVVHTSELYDLSPTNEAKRFKPKHDQHFIKTKEYGRKLLIDGEVKLVRHIIFALNADPKALKAMYNDTDNRRRFVGFKRKSTGLVCEKLKNYTFPDDAKDARALKKNIKGSVKETKASHGDNVMAKFLKSESSLVKHSSSASSSGATQVTCKSDTLRKEEYEHDTNLSWETAQTYTDSKSMKSSTSIPEVNHDSKELQNLREAVKEQKEENAFLKNQVLEKLTDIHAMLKPKEIVIEKLDSKSTDSVIFKRTKHSGIDDLHNLLSDDEEEVSNEKVKVGISRYVSRESIRKVEKDSNYLTARIESLLDAMYDNKVGQYSVSSKDQSTLITDEELVSIRKILLKMKWKETTKTSPKQIRDRVIKYTSKMRKHPPLPKGGKEADSQQSPSMGDKLVSGEVAVREREKSSPEKVTKLVPLTVDSDEDHNGTPEKEKKGLKRQRGPLSDSEDGEFDDFIKKFQKKTSEKKKNYSEDMFADEYDLGSETDYEPPLSQGGDGDTNAQYLNRSFHLEEL